MRKGIKELRFFHVDVDVAHNKWKVARTFKRSRAMDDP